jgi:hypothetical protein
LDFPQTYLPKLHHSYIFQLFCYSHLSHSHLEKIIPLAVFTRLCPKIIQKNNYSSTNYAKKLIKFLVKRKKKKKTKKWIYKQLALKV